MNSLELWNTLSTTNKIVDNKIFPKKEINIKGKGIVKYLEKTVNGVVIKCIDTIKMKATDDHVWTLLSNKDVHSNELKLGDTILGGETNAEPYTVTKLEAVNTKDFSYDVTTESAHFMANGMYSHNCRSWLSPIWEEVKYPRTQKFDYQWIDKDNIQYENAPGKNFNYSKKYTHEMIPAVAYDKLVINFNGNSGWVKKVTDDEVIVQQPKVYGRWNNGVVTVNLPHVGLEAREGNPDMLDADGKVIEDNSQKRIERFYEILQDRLELCHKALKIRQEDARKIKAKNSPILWMFGGLYRNHDNPELTVGEIIDKYPTRYSLSLGFVGLYETCEALLGVSNTDERGRQLSKDILHFINDTLDAWKQNEHIPYSLYGTPEESLTYKFAMANQRDFGYIEHITDKDYVVNSYHVDPREEIDAFNKLSIEGEYLALSSGGAVSYVETVDLTSNPEAIERVIRYMYDHIAYAEFNRKIGICYKCGYQGDIPLSKTTDGEFVFTCPHCGNKDDKFMNITARLCGYIGKVNAGETNRGRLDDIFHRVVHLQ